jgi:UDP-N-acetylglucosamine 2-epimerase (non-hydrolysing)
VKLLTVVGTRPELIRLSLVLPAIAAAGIDNRLLHTGQNYDRRLSEIFFEELELPEPNTYLGVRAETVGRQIGEIIARVEEEILAQRPDALLVLGDTNSGLASITAARHEVPIFHMEAGNRCFDWSVPEEKNRKLIDHVSTYLLPYTRRSREYLLAEGLAPDRILVSGNPITDVLEHQRGRWEASDVLDRLDLREREYVLVTAHRQETVDHPERLEVICRGLELVAAEYGFPVVFSVHPRTRERLSAAGRELDAAIQLHEPFGFADFVRLEAGAFCVISDSGTVQEECSLLKVPTVTCRETTERPETIECGSNVLCGVRDPRRMLECVRAMTTGWVDWESPYEGPEHRGVAERVARYAASLRS